MKISARRLFFVAPVLFLLLVGCAVRQEVSLSISGSGTVKGEIVLHPVFIAYLEDLTMALGKEEELPLFDLSAIRTALAGNQGVVLEALESPRRETLRFSLKFTDLNAPFKALPPVERNILEFRREGRQRSFNIVLGKENFSQVSAYFPLMDEAVMAYFIPRGNRIVTEEDYKDDLSYALEDYLKGTPIEEVLEASSVRITVGFEGTLTEQHGGRVEGKRVEFSIPLLKILVLNEPLEYGLTFLP